MSVPAKLNDSEMQSVLESLPGWKLSHGKLHREYRFADFVTAFGFMSMSALEIEKLGHHPEWLNVYSKVVVNLVTHDADGITQSDVALARALDGIAGKIR